MNRLHALALIWLVFSCREPGIVSITGERMDSGVDGGVCGLDVVLFVDFSGSMSDSLKDVRTQITQLPKEYRYALVGVPDSNPVHDTQVRVMVDFTDLYSLRKTLFSSAFEPTGGNSEPTLDCLAVVDTLPLSWKEGNHRAFVLFTDEKPQSFTTPFNKGEYLPDADVQIFTSVENFPKWQVETPQYDVQVLGANVLLGCAK